MGNDQSKAKAKAPEQPHPHATNVTPPVPIPSSTTSPTPAARPVTVPVPVTVPQAETMIGPSRVAYKSEAPPTSDTYPLQPAEYGRPPRLPLPIDEQVLMPGSPILAPREPGSAEVDELPRKESMLSSTTVDEEEIEDELPKSAEGVPQKTVPTLLEWAGPGEKVYVTGTFAKWDRKYKLHRNGPSKNKNALSATLQLQPGTHHLKFIVDGEMRLSDHLPTAVDFTNILVNYIEVSPDDIPSAPDAPPGSETPKPDYVVPANIHPPLRLSPPPEPKSVSPVAKVPGAIITPSAPEHATKPASIQPTSPKNYHTDIPTFLADYDTDERDPYFQRAAQVIGYGHPPPSLPMFLSKSILNSATPMKDDASVLVVPNHTVLNHLATSSIRHGVLATSGTTRYKRKVCPPQL
ncbi:hypothetical protein P152DRAFT_395218 [Eremomyces bilateralis CBS 781.70]|uniref:Association with the SNF1 complex (ASC) domain-containing protein n=1 Tax=Eremomyces bilateralis CBS 781.70 TaxID=1392243 RepID=A0A6G1G5T3_9PEZI|nr:uncharacterized protein P152DRAFT_395218 [Eremomyces bilateralis CBS 781.70]KAF1813296.1 hypothetical protein P152DRAFT_395218 [Eremomyces bilateralis CBS 781.70]